MKVETFFDHLLKLTKSTDYRDLMGKINQWSYNADFTYKDAILNDKRNFFRAFVIGQFYDIEPVISIVEIQEHVDLEPKDIAELKKWFKKLDLETKADSYL